MKSVFFVLAVATIVIATYAQSTPKSTVSATNVSDDYAKDARAALIAVVANPGTNDDYTTDQAFAAMQVDTSADEPADIKVYSGLLAIDINKQTDKIKGVAFPTACISDFAKELRSRNYTGMPESCK